MLISRIAEGAADEARLNAMLTTGAAVASSATAAPAEVASAAAAAAPAGGVGAAAGAWDTAANRDAAIASINALVTLTTEQKTVINGLRTLNVELQSQLNALLTELRNRKIIG